MSSIPQTGTNLWSVCSQYPWMGDPLWTDAWIADARYLDTTGSVGTVSPQKGTISLVQATGANKPTYSAAWGSQGKGMLTFDGVNDHMRGDALAAKVTGLQPFTTVTAFQALSLSTLQANVWSFGDTSATFDLLGLQIGTETGSPWRTPLVDNAGHLRENYSDFPASTASVVITTVFDPSVSGTPTSRIRVNATDRLVIGSQVGTIGVTTFSKFTVGAFFGASAVLFLNMKWRGTIFAPFALSSSQVASPENYLISEAA